MYNYWPQDRKFLLKCPRWSASLVTERFELADVGVSVKGAITGGTGRFQHAGGEAEQELLGISEQIAVSLRVRFGIR
jgi:hypothetical protein